MTESSTDTSNPRRSARLANLWGEDGRRLTGTRLPLLGASIICANPLRLEEDVHQLEKARIDLLHLDVMDGNFVPRLGVYPEMVAALRAATNLPIDVHLMVRDPERFVSVFATVGADIITVHMEASIQVVSLTRLVRNLGMRAGVALALPTPPDTLASLLDEVDLVLVMTTTPGTVGESAQPSALRRIRQVHDLLGDRSKFTHVAVDGNVGPHNAATMVNGGASILVCGSSSIFRQDADLVTSVRSFREGLGAQLGPNRTL